MNNLISLLKKNFGIIIILLSFVIVIVGGLINGSLVQALGSIRKADPFFILLAVLCYFGHIFFNGIANKSFINRQGYDISLKEAFYSSVVNIYYSNITPAGTGGFPMQIYYLSKKGIPVGVASSAVTCFINAWFLMRLLLITVFIVLRKQMLLDILGDNFIFLIFGLIYNIYIVVLFLVLGFVKKPIHFFIDLIDKAIRKFNLSKDPDGIRNKLTVTVERYHDVMQKMLLYPSEIVKQLIFGLFFVVLLNSIIYFAYRSVGLSSASYFDLLGMNLCQTVASAYIPTPGGTGGQELIFSLFFSSIIKGSDLLAVMLIWRFISFYLGLFLGAIFTSIKSIKESNR